MRVGVERQGAGEPLVGVLLVGGGVWTVGSSVIVGGVCFVFGNFATDAGEDGDVIFRD
jgi:hypothetical protein